MKKTMAMVLAVMMVVVLSVSAFATGPLSLDQAKQVALNYAGVNPAEAVFTKAYQSYDDGRAVYEIEFYAGNTEYDMDVDVNTGMVTDFSTDYFGGYGAPNFFGGPNGYGNGYYYDDDFYDYD